MMDYECFKNLVAGRIKEFLPPIFHSYTPKVQQVPKVNGMKDAFCLVPPENNPSVAIPTLYMNELYKEFCRSEDLDEILRETARVFITWSGIQVPELSEFRLEEHTDSIVANLVNTEMNEGLLSQTPHIDFMGMSVIFRLVQSISEEGINSAIISDAMLKGTDLTAEKLQCYAKENTRRMFPGKIIEAREENVFVVTNEAEYYGATVMLYNEEMQRLASRMGGDFYIMPTSIHEFFAIGTEEASPEFLIRLLANGNETITRPEDQLSNAIYRFRRSDGLIERVVSYSAKQ